MVGFPFYREGEELPGQLRKPAPSWAPSAKLTMPSPWFLSAGRDEGPTSEPDEALVDECCLLPSQLLIPSLDWLPVSDGLVSRLQPKQPLRLHFGKAPVLPGSASTLQLDGLIRCVPSAVGPWRILSGGFTFTEPTCFMLLPQGCCAVPAASF